jgi:hypothetical protein
MNVLEKDPEEEKRKQEEQRNIEEGQNPCSDFDPLLQAPVQF